MNLPLACGFAQQRPCTLPDAGIKKVGGWVHPSLGMMEELKGLRKLRVFASELLRPGYPSWIKDGKTEVGSMDGEKLKGLMVVLRQRDQKMVASLQMQGKELRGCQDRGEVVMKPGYVNFKEQGFSKKEGTVV